MYIALLITADFAEGGSADWSCHGEWAMKIGGWRELSLEGYTRQA